MKNRKIIFLCAALLELSLLSVGQALDPWQIYDKLEEKYRIRCDNSGMPIMRMHETYIVTSSLEISYMMWTNEEQDIFLFLNTTNKWTHHFLMSGSNANTAGEAASPKTGLRKTDTPTTGRTVPPKANASGGQ
jgi:hypothetical protein